MRIVALAALVALPDVALAWEHTRMVWVEEDQPVAYEVSDYAEDSVPAGYPVTAVQGGYDAWQVADCAEISAMFSGTTPDNTGFQYDFVNRHTFDDPEDELTAGVIAASLTLPPVGAGEVAFQLDGVTYYRALDSDVVFNDNVDFGTETDVQSPGCDDTWSLLGMAVHEVGHQLGLGHSCDPSDPCDDAELVQAAMHWSTPACSTHASIIHADDVRGLNALYSPLPMPTMACGPADGLVSQSTVIGLAPLDVQCRTLPGFASSEASASWEFGDGDQATGLDAFHTYAEPGNYTVSACWEPGVDGCPDLAQCQTRVNYVRVCPPVQAAVDAERVTGRTWRLLNDTELAVDGCIDHVWWEVTDDDGEIVFESDAWEPEVELHGGGRHNVLLTVGGPVGSDTAQLEFGGGIACACDAGPRGAGGWLVLLPVLALLRRRGVLVVAAAAAVACSSKANDVTPPGQRASCDLFTELADGLPEAGAEPWATWDTTFGMHGWIASDTVWIGDDLYQRVEQEVTADGRLVERSTEWGELTTPRTDTEWWTYDGEGREVLWEWEADYGEDVVVAGRVATTWFADGVLQDYGYGADWTELQYDTAGNLLLARLDLGRDGAFDRVHAFAYPDASTVVESVDRGNDGDVDDEYTYGYDASDRLVYLLETRPDAGYVVREVEWGWYDDFFEEWERGTVLDRGDPQIEYLYEVTFDDRGLYLSATLDETAFPDAWMSERDSHWRYSWDCPEQ